MNTLIKDPTELSGLLGESATVRKINGRVVIKNRPRRRVVANPSQKQLDVIDKMKEGAEWAKQQMAQPEVKALYASRVNDRLKSPFIVALTDYLTPPKVKSIDVRQYKGAVGDIVVTKATDDFMVTQLSVIIADPTGKILEQGKAVKDATNSFLWNYTATVANPALAGTKISATAYDRPGNETLFEQVL